MTPADLDRIESALGVTLPQSYRRAVAPYPVAAAAGNAEFDIWDDADRLIEYNRRLRAGATPWPPHLFAVGHPGDGSPYALDLRGGDGDGDGDGDTVWWVDHAQAGERTMVRQAAPFAQWAGEFFETLRAEMRGEDVDPAGTPAQRAEVEARTTRAASFSCLVTALGVGAVVLLLRWIL